MMHFTKKAEIECRGCEATFVGNAGCDEDGDIFVDFGGENPIFECDMCGRETCKECSKKCAGCWDNVCPACQVATDIGAMCSVCAAEYMLQSAEPEVSAAGGM